MKTRYMKATSIRMSRLNQLLNSDSICIRAHMAISNIDMFIRNAMQHLTGKSSHTSLGFIWYHAMTKLNLITNQDWNMKCPWTNIHLYYWLHTKVLEAGMSTVAVCQVNDKTTLIGYQKLWILTSWSDWGQNKIKIVIYQYVHLVTSMNFINNNLWLVIRLASVALFAAPQIVRFIGPTLGSPGSCRPQVGPMLAP